MHYYNYNTMHKKSDISKEMSDSQQIEKVFIHTKRILMYPLRVT